MNVGKLIRKLTKLPMDAEVWVSDWRGVETKVAYVEPGASDDADDDTTYAILVTEET